MPTCHVVDISLLAFLTATGSPGHVTPAEVTGPGSLTSLVVSVSVSTTTFTATCIIEEVTCVAFCHTCRGVHGSGVMKR